MKHINFLNYLLLIPFASSILLLTASVASSSDIFLSNYPNPFDSRKTSTSILVKKSNQTDVGIAVKIFDLFGRPVKHLEFFGDTILWDGRDENGHYVAKGGYICVVSVDGGKIVALRKIGVIH